MTSISVVRWYLREFPMRLGICSAKQSREWCDRELIDGSLSRHDVVLPSIDTVRCDAQRWYTALCCRRCSAQLLQWQFYTVCCVWLSVIEDKCSSEQTAPRSSQSYALHSILQQVSHFQELAHSGLASSGENSGNPKEFELANPGRTDI